MTSLNKRIELLAKRKGLTFKPWEWPLPWDIEDGEACGYPPDSAGGRWWPKCQQIRAALIAELESEDARNRDQDSVV